MLIPVGIAIIAVAWGSAIPPPETKAGDLRVRLPPGSVDGH